MSIQNKGSVIKAARKKANFTQKQLSDGICSVQTLSLIEGSGFTVSASYFEALMSRTGNSTSVYPYYKNRDDFNCFYALKHASFYINSWQLDKAYEALDFVEQHNWAENKFHYAEWILLHGKLQFLSGCCDHANNYSFLLYGLSLTTPNLNLMDFDNHLFSVTELEYLLLIAEEKLHLHDKIGSFRICSQIEQYLSQTHIAYLDKERLLAQCALVLGKYYIAETQYDLALSTLESHRHQMAVNGEDFQLLRLTFLKGLCLYKKEESEEALKVIRTALFSAYAIDSCYATTCFDYLRTNTDIDIESLFPLECAELKQYNTKNHILFTQQDFYTSPIPTYFTYLSLGEIMKQLREEQHLSQEIICQGLCTKSTLSKIEHNHLQPDIFMTEALLQRLGISERPFEFYGNKQEHDFYTLKFKSMHTQLFNVDVLCNMISDLEKILAPKNVLQQQFLCLSKASLRPTADEKIQTYFDALHYTLPHFDIARIHEFRLSWAEASILNNIAHLYIKTDTPTKSFYYFHQLESYYKSIQPSALFSKNVYLPMLEMCCHSLYNQKYYNEAHCFFTSTKINYIRQNTNRYSFFLFYYSQILGELQQYESAYQYGNEASALCKLNELDINSRYLTNYLHEDFGINLLEF